MTYPIRYDKAVESLPVEWTSPAILEEIQSGMRSAKRKLVVLDDDPTGVQTVHDIYVLTQWDKPLLRQTMQDSRPLFFILTNTRSMVPEEAEAINRDIAANVLEVAKEQGYDVEFVSRSDSTLRGHYPLEIDILSEAQEKFNGKGYDGHLIVPAFFEADRYTFKNVHYLKVDQELVPVHMTEFAKDKVFGYSHSDLRFWTAEKTETRFRPEQCISIRVELIRQGPNAVEAKLMRAADNVPIIINAMSYADLRVVSLALHHAYEKGKRFIYRTAASFVKAYAGMDDYDYLTVEQMTTKGLENRGGLIIVGSHTAKTTAQLNHVLQNAPVEPLEMNVERILDPEQRVIELKRLSTEMNEKLSNGVSAVVFSSRKLVAVEDKAGNLKISQSVSSALVELVQSLPMAPRFVIAKGGITSSDVATKGLQIRKAKVLGQAAAGVPVWFTGEESKFPNIPYIIFPGNVGGDTTLLEIVRNVIGSSGGNVLC